MKEKKGLLIACLICLFVCFALPGESAAEEVQLKRLSSKEIKALESEAEGARSCFFGHNYSFIQLNKYISGMSISLDGLKDSHNFLRNNDTFDKAIEKIKLCKKLNMKYLAIKTTVYKKNLKELKDLYNLLIQLNIDEWHLFPMEPVGRWDLNKNIVLSELEYRELCEFIDSIKNKKDVKIKEGLKKSFVRVKTYIFYVKSLKQFWV